MKIIYFAFKHRYRIKDLNNFLKTKKYGNFFVINFSGPLKHYFAKFLNIMNIGKAISCDGSPLIPNKKKGYNFYMRGTDFNIPSNLTNYNNNIVTVKHALLQNKNIFQIYPIDIDKNEIKKDFKIVYMSTINLEFDSDKKNFWENNKEKILEDFTIIDNKDFLLNKLNDKNLHEINGYYRAIKLHLRFEIVSYLKKKLKDKFILIGDDWKKYFFDALNSNYNIKENKKIYKGNICLDLGCIEGSSSFYSRSNQIIESGGLIIQSKQMDSNEKWGQLSKEIIFKDFNDLNFIINEVLNDYHNANKILTKIFNHFSNSHKDLEKNLRNYF